jgi:hypothetical protein
MMQLQRSPSCLMPITLMAAAAQRNPHNAETVCALNTLRDQGRMIRGDHGHNTLNLLAFLGREIEG